MGSEPDNPTWATRTGLRGFFGGLGGEGRDREIGGNRKKMKREKAGGKIWGIRVRSERKHKKAGETRRERKSRIRGKGGRREIGSDIDMEGSTYPFSIFLFY